MRIAVGSNHAGYGLKSRVVRVLEDEGHEVVDVGADSEESTDYPVHAERAARLVAGGEAEYGVLVCGSETGVSIAANKVRGVPAVNGHDREEAELGRRQRRERAGPRGPGPGCRRRRRDHMRVPGGRLRGRSPQPARRSDRRHREERQWPRLTPSTS